MDAPVRINSMGNTLGCLYQGKKNHAGTDTIEFILHKEKPKYRMATHVKSVCNIILLKTETNRTRLTAGVNLIYYPG